MITQHVPSGGIRRISIARTDVQVAVGLSLMRRFNLPATMDVHIIVLELASMGVS